MSATGLDVFDRTLQITNIRLDEIMETEVGDLQGPVKDVDACRAHDSLPWVRTLQITNIWLDEIMETLGPDRQVAWHALGAVLRALRDRLPIGLAVHLGAQLPLLVRGLYYDQWAPSEQVLKQRSREEFLAHVSDGLKNIRPV